MIHNPLGHRKDVKTETSAEPLGCGNLRLEIGKIGKIGKQAPAPTLWRDLLSLVPNTAGISTPTASRGVLVCLI